MIATIQAAKDLRNIVQDAVFLWNVAKEYVNDLNQIPEDTKSIELVSYRLEKTINDPDPWQSDYVEFFENEWSIIQFEDISF
tara:strand:+ start:28 stop:273 length:246 start_codon:yes stop_codon:yes gene_type:complete